MTHRPVLAVLLAAALSAPAPALAQQRVGGDGHAHDANPQAGSGGYNAVGGRVDYAARNDRITGNVGDFSHFRGDVGYRAPGEFRGSLGSDDTFRFRADSLPSSPVYQGRGAYLGDPAASPTSVYRSYTQIADNRLLPGGPLDHRQRGRLLQPRCQRSPHGHGADCALHRRVAICPGHRLG